MPHSESQTCKQRTESGVKDVCCADTEAHGNGCIPCSKGYTSTMGQSCRPCPNKTYGERCGSDCICSGLQICEHVKGCVEIPPTTGTSAHTTSDDRTYPWTQRTPTHSERDSFSQTTVKISDKTTLPQILDASTNGESTDTNVQATVHNKTDSSGVDNKSGVFSKDENILQYAMDRDEIGLRRPYEYENSSISVECAVDRHCLSCIRGRDSKSCENLNHIKRIKTVSHSANDGQHVLSDEDDSLDYYNISKTRSESDIFCKHSLKE
ncbi:unnamed protein product [Mytilus coruscus]|uniref:MEGF10_11 n=1 Tax=Mytilus coruscus TaxID=42192 RepID=A0A6J8D7B2_MYTCO|nr:unnamed protein product [Mytilus coruscus]